MPDSRTSTEASLSTATTAEEELRVVEDTSGDDVQGRIVCQFGSHYYQDERNAEGLLCRGRELKSYT
ncbi:MAG: hypothetical protein H6741_34415 [Alphaproteobacteria bacterium]|nr:hypothetical protein [Alphaproteobacteria bacterium]MCB9797802.1 hypothetical protein [Alphaproteobacteria bacterium]